MANLRVSVPIGAHRVLWTPSGGTETDMGLTAEGVEIEIDQSMYERTVHESAVPFDAVIDEINLTSEIILKEVNADILAAALNGLVTTVAGPPEKEGMDISPVRGRQASFGKLVFRPRSKTGVGGTDVSEDKTIFNAMVMGSSNRIFKANEDGTVTLSVKGGLHWDSTASKYKFYCEGDPTAYAGFNI